MFDVEALIARLPHESDENDEDPDVAATVREFVDCEPPPAEEGGL